MSETPTIIAGPQGSPSIPGRDNLALLYQELLTVVARLRANRQIVADATTFRASMKSALAAAEAEATRKGYQFENVRLASFAVVAFLDESVENANSPAFADWRHHPLQSEMFNEKAAGEVFFQCIDRLLGLADSREVADVLEVFGLCLLLGYHERYRTRAQTGVRPVAEAITEKVQRIRGTLPLAPRWAPPQDMVLQPPDDPWGRALFFGAAGALIFAVLLFVGFKIALLSGASELHALSLLGPP